MGSYSLGGGVKLPDVMVSIPQPSWACSVPPVPHPWRTHEEPHAMASGPCGPAGSYIPGGDMKSPVQQPAACWSPQPLWGTQSSPM